MPGFLFEIYNHSIVIWQSLLNCNHWPLQTDQIEKQPEKGALFMLKQRSESPDPDLKTYKRICSDTDITINLDKSINPVIRT